MTDQTPETPPAQPANSQSPQPQVTPQAVYVKDVSFESPNGPFGQFEGQPAALSFGRDLTERDALDARLKVADRMASVGTMAAGVAHELNNPLAFVTANVAFVQNELKSKAHAGEARSEWLQALSEAEDGARRKEHRNVARIA